MSYNGIEKFNGERLQRALKARRWSVADLSEYTGISSSMLYHLVNNKRKPSYETFKTIVQQINLPETYFFKDFEHHPAHPFFRKFARSLKKRRRSVETQIDWLIEIKAFLDDYINFPKLSIPYFSIIDEQSETEFNYSNADVDSIAEGTRKAWELGTGKISSITRVLEKNGITVSKFNFGTQDIDGLSKYDNTRDNAFIIHSEDKGQNSRTRFDLAHELGHCILHRHLNPQKIDLKDKEIHSELEDQANRFAGAFLLPEQTYSRDFDFANFETFKYLKTKYGVSISFLVFRAKELKLIDQQTYKNLQINISRNKWRSREPLEDEVPVEKPSVLRKALDLLLGERELSLSDMIKEIGLKQSDIERLTGLETGYLDKYKPDNSPNANLRLVK